MRRPDHQLASWHDLITPSSPPALTDPCRVVVRDTRLPPGRTGPPLVSRRRLMVHAIVDTALAVFYAGTTVFLTWAASQLSISGSSSFAQATASAAGSAAIAAVTLTLAAISTVKASNGQPRPAMAAATVWLALLHLALTILFLLVAAVSNPSAALTALMPVGLALQAGLIVFSTHDAAQRYSHSSVHAPRQS